jgi:catechol 2,3-dioxygenase-like lactoylglutathione lyase family enzyme
MISHVFVGVGDFERSFAFYAAVMGELGFTLKFRDDDRPWAGWIETGRPRPIFLIGRPFDGGPATAGNGAMTALLAPDRASVDRAYRAALNPDISQKEVHRGRESAKVVLRE